MIVMRTITKGLRPQEKLSFLLFSTTIFFLTIFALIHSEQWLPEATLLVAFLSLFPLFAIAFLFFTHQSFGFQKQEGIWLFACVVHTVVILGGMALFSWRGRMMPLSVPYFSSYVIISTIAVSVLGLVWSWRKFSKMTEFSQARAACFMLASIAVIAAFFVNLSIYSVCRNLWSSMFLLPYLFIVASTLMGERIAWLEKELQAFLVNMTAFAVYYFFFFGIIAIPVFRQRLFAHPLCCNGFAVLSLFAVVFTYQALRQGIIKVYKTFLFRPVINYRLLFRNFSNALLAFVDIDRIVEVIVSIVHDGYAVDVVSCFLFNTEKKLYERKAAVGENVAITTFAAQHPMVAEVKKRFRVMLRSDLAKKADPGVAELFKALRAEVAIPFQYKDGHMGFVFVGARQNGAKYNDDDLELFSMLEGQISVAINNALFFKTQHDSYELMAQKNKMDAVIALSSGVNHEINNPLSIISMKSQNFLRKISQKKFASAEETIADATEVIDSALRNAGRAYMITRRLGDFAKPVKDVLEPEDLDLLTYVKETIALMGENKFAQDSIKINYEFPEHLDRVRCDKSHLRQILFNVIVNAHHAIEQEGTITIAAGMADEDFIRLDITDDGCGIKKEELEKIWEPFFTTKPQKPAAENRFTGTGLGLALVKRYIEHSGGRVEVRSEVGQGTTFSLYFERVHKKNTTHNS
jgi:signal transduction histidine kinase